MSKRMLFLFCITLVSSYAAYAQVNDTLRLVPKPPNTFRNFDSIRMKGVASLIGVTQNGVKVSFDKDKSKFEGAYGDRIKGTRFFVLGNGSVGTTSNLSDMFRDNYQPAFSLGLTVHMLIPYWSKSFYDATFSANAAEMRKKKGTPSSAYLTTYIDTTKGEDTIMVGTFSYKDGLIAKVEKGSIGDSLTTSTRYAWLTFNVAYDNAKYSFYHPQAAFSQQITSPFFHTFSGKLSFNYFQSWNKADVKWKRPKLNFLYGLLSLKYGLDNNTALLNKVTINDVTSVDSSNGVVRQTVKSSNPYKGQYKEYHTLQPSFEFLLSPVNHFALDVFGDYAAIIKSDKDRWGIKNNYSMAGGIYYYSNAEKFRINLGVYIKWSKDMTDNSWTNQVGFKTSIPINP